jgi:uncharacterized protein
VSKSVKRISLSLLLTYCLTLLFFLVLELYGGPTNRITNSLLGIPMIFPIFSIWFVQRICYKEPILRQLGLKWVFNRWLIIAIILPVTMALVVDALSIFSHHGPLFTWGSVVVAVLIGISISALSALLEEVAWRGFYFSQFKGIGRTKSALLIGGMWATFHVPVTIFYVYPHAQIEGTLIYFAQMFCLSLILSLLRERSNTVLAPTLFHGLLNTMVLTISMDTFGLVSAKIILSVLVVLILFFVTRSHESMDRGQSVDTLTDA